MLFYHRPICSMSLIRTVPFISGGTDSGVCVENDKLLMHNEFTAVLDTMFCQRRAHEQRGRTKKATPGIPERKSGTTCSLRLCELIGSAPVGQSHAASKVIALAFEKVFDAPFPVPLFPTQHIS